MEDSFTLGATAVEILKTLTGAALTRRIESLDPKKGAVFSRKVPLDSPPAAAKASAGKTSDYIYIEGVTEMGYQKAIKCLPYSKENAEKIAEFLATVIPGWK